MANAIATVLVAIIGLIGIYLQTKSKDKMDSQKSLLDTVNKNINDLKKESKDDDKKLHKRLDKMEMDHCKRFLIVEMSKIKDGTYVPNEEQKRILHETKEVYNEMGGDSYVDSMFEDLQEKKIL